jgi:glutamate-ammonia-ligase adenylyltransferase
MGADSDADWQRRWVDAAGEPARAVLARLPAAALLAADPQRAVDDLRRLVASAGPAIAGPLAAESQALDLLVQLGGVTRSGFDAALRRPELLWEVIAERQHRQVWGRRALARELEAALHGATDDEAQALAMARTKERHYLRLALGDVTGGIGFEGIIAELSDLTDALVQSALGLARAKLAPRFPGAEARFVVLGMGKLGGRELNYSSDIDLVFVYEDLAPEREWGCHEYCQKLGADLIRRLDESGPGGRLFRVDMRLRPEGDRGELALSLRETIDYYYSVGRPWERQALIKARPIAGDLALGERLFGELRPWIYPKEPAWEDLDGTRAMRRRIEERKALNDVKTGAGGIRDIEFLVQFFQLSHGGRIPDLRGRATLPVLRALPDHGLLPRGHARELERHYVFLRVVEHRLQMWEDRQIHEVPPAATARLSLARRCGFAGERALAEFDARLAEVRGRVRALADRHYLRTTRDQDAILALVAQDEIDAGLAEAVLGACGLRDLPRAARNLRAMATEPFFLLARSRTERALAALVPLMLELVRDTPDPDATLENLARIAAAVGGRATFYDLLGGNPKALRLFCDLAGWATYLVNLLGEVPGLPDEIADSLNQPPRRPDMLLREARFLVQGLQDLVPPLRFFQARELAATAVRDLEGWTQAQVSRHLSHLAIAITGVALERAVGERARDWGLPVESYRQTRFAVLGLGKLGSRELSYASDMDVIFVCDPGGTCRRNGKGGDEFWTRVAQDVMRTLGEGRIYEIDPRLRPWGDGSELVPTLDALRRYWSEPRDLWERMAMLRVAHVGGDPSIGMECVDLIRATALLAPLPQSAGADVRDMRRRLEESVAGRDHVKRGRGGYVDHEFIAHFRSFGVPPGDLPPGGAIAETLRRLGELGRIPGAAAEELVAGLGWLRFVEARMRLTAGKAVSSIPTDPAARLELARRCNHTSLADFDAAMHQARETGRRWFEELVR